MLDFARIDNRTGKMLGKGVSILTQALFYGIP